MIQLIVTLISLIPTIEKLFDQISMAILAKKIAYATDGRAKGIEDLKNAATEQEVYTALSAIVSSKSV